MQNSTLEVGQIIGLPDPNSAIPSWKAATDYSCKIIKQPDGIWTPRTELNRKGSGLVVFVERELAPGEKLKISEIHQKFARAKIVN